ncbi:MAG: hypothetical protein AB7N91_00040 [Candidatus Tectimicrobiota bacterium]
MADIDGITVEALRFLAERVGMQLSTTELEQLKPVFDFYAPQLQELHAAELAAEDMAVVYSPNWDPQV